MTARHHHYLSQCYLKGFTKGGAKKSKLTVIDFKENKRFETIPRNVGGIRDFNRIDIEGVEQNALEKSLSQFEGEAASALRNLEENLHFEGETRILILNLIALLAIRSPEMREHWRQCHAQIAERVMDLSLATKERWESQLRQMKESGKEVSDDITYEEIKRFHESKEYDITVAREHHIHMEFVGVDAILPYLDSRNWLLIKVTEESGPFITTDNPVNITWKEPDKIPLFYRNSPGYGMRGTQVYFPVSRNLALIGEFDGPEGIIDGNRELVSALNYKMLIFTYKQVYCPKIGFYFRGADGAPLEGTQVLKHIGA
ncbi:DUF4238 domain-containing protein [Halomonas sp. 25-S5]|uniref:DUF4238 domain-containing protein n=1 Tax=Halomonas sp. 25-S5 TaxID=2994065 RepID=UPI002468307F|nr:DUF4238 domain-containing protein [Halomonas sp. 25-S5]